MKVVRREYSIAGTPVKSYTGTMAREPRPPDESKETPHDIESAELRAKVCREYRRGLTLKNIAGGLGISLYRVQKIVDEDLSFIQNLSPKSHKIILGLPSGDAEKEEQQLELKRKLREQREQVREEQTRRTSHNASPPSPPQLNGSSPPNSQNQNQITLYRSRPQVQPNYYQLRKKAFQLRKEGKTYEDIADLIGSSPQDAQKMVREQLSSLSLDEYQDRELARRMQLERLDALMAAVWPSATKAPTEDFPDQGPDLEASRTALRILERQSKLLGLDSPAKIDISDRIRIIAERNGVDYEDMMEYVRESAKLKLAPTS